MRTLLLTFLFSFTFPFVSSSQSYFSGPIKEDLLKGRVKQVEEFMARFNYEEDWEGKKVKQHADTILRSKYLHTLFDYSRFRQRNGNLTPLAELFIRDVIRYGYMIHYTDTSWISQVKCRAMVDGKKAKITLYFHTQQVAPYEYKWKISRVESPSLAIIPESISRLCLSPIEHEIGFTGILSLSLENLKFTEIDDVRYHFFNIPGYAFTIERIERKNSYNTGWLITNLNPL